MAVYPGERVPSTPVPASNIEVWGAAAVRWHKPETVGSQKPVDVSSQFKFDTSHPKCGNGEARAVSIEGGMMVGGVACLMTEEMPDGVITDVNSVPTPFTLNAILDGERIMSKSDLCRRLCPNRMRPGAKCDIDGNEIIETGEVPINLTFADIIDI